MIKGTASLEETKAVVRHLLAGCGPCIERSEAARREVGDLDLWNYDAVFARLESLLVGVNPDRGGRPSVLVSQASVWT